MTTKHQVNRCAARRMRSFSILTGGFFVGSSPALALISIGIDLSTQADTNASSNGSGVLDAIVVWGI